MIKKNKKRIVFITLLFIFVFSVTLFQAKNTNATSLAEQLKGKILLQVEQNGEAWYVNPQDLKRYYMGRPDDAFDLMRNLGVGITNNDLVKIQIADANLSGDNDQDGDGLSDMLEDSIGLNKTNVDSDNDGYNDKTEILNGYNLINSNSPSVDNTFSKKQAGKILLQVEQNGEAWYIYPNDNKRYFLGRPQDAFNIMRSLGLGITDEDINSIESANFQMEDVAKEDTSPSGLEGSPFGVADYISSYSSVKSQISDLNIKSIRLAGPSAIHYDRINTEGWTNDGLYSDLYNNNQELSVIVIYGNPVETNTISEYGQFISEVAERYDGDGIDDAEGSPVIAYLEIDNEPDLLEPNERTAWTSDIDETKDYALMLKTAYEAIKSSSPNIKVTIAGMAGNIDYYEAILEELAKLKENSNDKFFDTFNYHYYGSYLDYGQNAISMQGGQNGPSLPEINSLLNKYGYSDTEIILTETGTYNGQPNRLDNQNEQEQALSLLKRYVYAISNGVDRIYWLGLSKSQSSFFDMMALIYDNNKVLAYYTYKQMAEKLEGSDWNNIKTIQESGSIYIYKFIKNSKPIWIAWSDSGPQTISLTIGNYSTVKITEAVPKYETGKEVTDYDNAFSAETKTVNNSKLTITLGENPIFIE